MLHVAAGVGKEQRGTCLFRLGVDRDVVHLKFARTLLDN